MLFSFGGLKIIFFLFLQREELCLIQLENMKNFRQLQFVICWEGFAGKIVFGAFFLPVAATRHGSLYLSANPVLFLNGPSAQHSYFTVSGTVSTLIC